MLSLLVQGLDKEIYRWGKVGCSVWYPPVVARALTVRYRDSGDRRSGSKEGSWGRCTGPDIIIRFYTVSSG